MKGLAVLLVGVVIVFFSEGYAQAAQAASATVRIGVVDLQKFQKNSKAFQKTGSVVKKKFDEMQQKLDQERDALAKLEDEFKKQSAMLSLDAQEDKKKEVEKKRRYYKFLYDEFTQEMKDTEVEAIKKIMQELEKIVAKMAEKEGYTLILERRVLGLIYYNEAIDITDRVTEAYDKSKP
jgi:outer membrane protein